MTAHHTIRTRVCLALTAGLFVVLGAVTAPAGNVISTGTGDWNNGATWGGTAPAASDDVFIASGDTVTINGTGVTNINSLSVSGILQHAENSSSKAHEVNLDIANDCTIASGGKIEVTGRGYSSGGPGVPSAGYSGGSHGGRGGLNGGGVDDAGVTYGSLTAPETMGSAASSGPDGGGVIKLTVDGTTTVDGAILANGEFGSYAGGAGGSVFITTASFGGSGSVTANGGKNGTTGGTHGAGGGGRVAVVLTSGSSFGSVGLYADRGCGTVNKGGQNGFSSGGTVYTKTPSQTYGTVKIDNSGYGLYDSGDATPNLTPGTWIPSNHTWQVDKLELVNSGNLFVGEEATLNIASGDFGDSTTNGSLVLFGTAVLPADLTISNISFMPHWDNTLTGLTNLTIASGGVLKHLDNSTTEAYRLDIDIPGDFTLEVGAKIDVTGLGYNTGQGPGVPSYSYSGGSYGGRGGLLGGTRSQAGSTYGSLSSPTNCGSGGSNSGTGGGAVRITAAGTTTINGKILAEGGPGTSYDSGSGGSVFITTANFAGSGTISANGGVKSTSTHGAGGGGRVAVVLTSGSTFGSVTITADRGAGVNNYGGAAGYSAAGTIFTKTPSQTYGKVKVDNSGKDLWAGGSLTPGTYIPDGATWQVDQVELVNGGALWIDDTSTLIVSDTSPSTTNGMLINEGTLSTPGDFTVTNITFMPIAGSSFSGLTNLTVANGAIVSHVDNHTAEDWTLELTVPGDLTINGGGQINIDGKGYWRGNGPAGGGNYGMGGGYGGQGGSGRDAGQGTKETYGSITSPTNIGSAGQRYTSDESDGGGAAKITVGETTTVDGMISANGKSTTTYLDGGGSGGSVWLTTSNLVGAGTIRADGGSAANGSTSGGGGGRIAVHLTGSDSFGSVVMQAYGKTGNRKGAAGTVYLQTESQGANKGTLIVDNNGLVTTHGERTQISDTVTDTAVGDVIIRNSGHFEVNTNQSITVYGSWSNAASYEAESGSLVELAGTDTVTIFGDNTFEKLVCSNVTKQINFEVSATQDVDNAFTFSGPTDTSLVLRSTSPGTTWGLDLDPGVVMTIEYVDVQDSHARNLQAVAASSKDSGNNTNWSFSAGGPETNIWIGAVDASWGEGGNWTLGRAPIGTDIAVIFSNGLNQATLPSPQTFNNMEVWTGATLSLANFDLTVSGETVVQGTITPSGSETLTFSNLTVSGTLTAVGSQEIYIAGDVDFTGGTFTEATSHVILNGDVAQSITSAGEIFATLTASNQSALVTFADAVVATTYYSRNGNVTYGGNFDATLFDVYSENGSITQTFNAGSTYTFDEIWLRGTSGNTQHLESSSTAKWNLNVANVANVESVNAEYSDADGGIEIQAINSANSGNNDNWNFGPFSIWNGSGTDFHTAGNWTPPGVPGVDSYIIVDDTTTCNVDSPANVKYAKIGGVNATLMQIDSSFVVGDNVDVINNGTLEINNDPGMTVSGNVSVANGGMLNHKDNSTTEADRMVLTVLGNLVIAAGAEIDVTGLGYNRDYGLGTPTGGGVYSGAGHGGRGGLGYVTRGNEGMTYGSLKEPINLGSGSSDDSGGTGGGAVQLTVGGTTTVDGKILAVGGDGDSYDSGSGGSVYITTGSFAGSGTISVNGGFKSTGVHGAGGGGRMAIVLTNGSSFGSVTLTAYAGGSPNYGGGGGFPGAGTIYTKIPSQTHGTLKVDNNGEGLYNGDDLTAGTWIPSNQTWQVDSVELVNGGHVWIGSNATLIMSDTSSSTTNGYLINEGTLTVPASFTVSNVTFMPLAGSTFDGTDLIVAAGGVVSHVDNKTTEDFTLELSVPGDLTINAGAEISVDGKGYWRGLGPAGGGNYAMGGGYGGQGGHGRDGGQDPDEAYGSIMSPTNIGSAGQRYDGPDETDGGGAAKITVGGTTTVNGTISANGKTTASNLDGAGSGGSVWLTTASLAGAGTIRANGGEGTVAAASGGGGGRIAVYLTGSDSFGSVSVEAFGGDGANYEGAAGTIYRETQSQGSGGGTVLVDNNGLDTTQGERTQLPAGQSPAYSNELVDATLIVTNADTELELTVEVTVGDILVYTDADLILGSYTMYVNSAEHHIDDASQAGPGGPTNTVVDNYQQIVWQGVTEQSGLSLIFK